MWVCETTVDFTPHHRMNDEAADMTFQPVSFKDGSPRWTQLSGHSLILTEWVEAQSLTETSSPDWFLSFWWEVGKAAKKAGLMTSPPLLLTVFFSSVSSQDFWIVIKVKIISRIFQWSFHTNGKLSTFTFCSVWMTVVYPELLWYHMDD